jgi:hypothetical protein
VYGGGGREVLAYHLHPQVDQVPYPHLHIGPGAVEEASLVRAGLSEQHSALRPAIARAHLPTGLVALRWVVRMLITQFGVTALRRDWPSILSVDG